MSVLGPYWVFVPKNSVLLIPSNLSDEKMNYVLKRDPVWLQLLNPSSGPSDTLLLLGGDGHQVAVPAPLLLAASPLVRNILTDHLPPACSPCCFSIPAATGDVLQLVWDIVTTGKAIGDHGERIEEVKQVLKSLRVEASIVSGSPGKKSTDRKMEVEDLDSLYTDLEFKGVFAGVILHF